MNKPITTIVSHQLVMAALSIAVSSCDVIAPHSTRSSISEPDLVFLEAGVEQAVFSLAAGEPVPMDLGAIAHSRDFYFEVRLPGDESIQRIDLELESGFEGMSLFPDHLDEVEPVAHRMAPAVFRLSVIHGLTFPGPTSSAVIPKGGIHATLRLTWKTNSDSVVERRVRIKMHGIVADVEFFDESGVFGKDDILYYRTTTNFQIPDRIAVFDKSGPVWAVNTGSVPVPLAHLAKNYRADRLLMPQDTIRILESYNTGWIQISPEYATLDYSRHDLASDSYSYYYFSHGGF